jgi:formamidopyrimidine-DNA glycosylase
MPELPDVSVYVECLAVRIVGQPLVQIRLGSPFVLRSPIGDAEGRDVCAVSRLDQLTISRRT